MRQWHEEISRGTSAMSNRKPWIARLPYEPFVAVLALGILWEAVAEYVGNRVLLPPPSLVLPALFEIFGDKLLSDILASLYHLASGFLLGAMTGFVLALLATTSRTVETLVDPLVEILRPISGIAWIPIAIMMFGIGEAVPIFLIFYVSIFPIFINTFAGIKAVDIRLVNAARVLGASRPAIMTRVILPAATPNILAGLRLSLGVSWMTLIAAELIGADSGLGWRAFWYEQFFSMHKTLAVILVVGVIGYLMDGLVRKAQSRLTSWAPDGGGVVQ